MRDGVITAEISCSDSKVYGSLVKSGTWALELDLATSEYQED